ncbi:MAG: DUF3857 domain-containing protein [Dysgonomonas sp.]
MKKNILFLFLFIIFSTDNYSQSKYGNITSEELNMVVYAQDSTASAVILLKKGETRFTYDSQRDNFQYEHFIETKIKILKPEGLDWCNQNIYYIEENFQNRERINGLSGTTYNLEDGKIIKTKLTKEQMSDETVDERWKVKKFTMPAAKVGSVIEFKYTIVSDYFADLRDFEFQSQIPVAYAYYEITIPEYFRFNKDMQGFEPVTAKQEITREVFTIHSRGRVDNISCNADRWMLEGKNISALKKEPYVWSLNDYISKVSFEIHSIQFPYSKLYNYVTTWQSIDQNYFHKGDFNNNLKKKGLFKDIVVEDEPTLEKARGILGLIKNKVKWDGRNRMNPSNLGDALKKGLGSSADMNFLLINALKASNFNVYPVVLSTREHGRLPISHPTILAFNYVIAAVKIDTMMYYTDASSLYGDWNVLPQKCMVPQARFIGDDNSYWVDLTTVSTGTTFINAGYSFVDNQYTGNLKESYRGNSALKFRNYYYDNHKNKEDYVEKLSTQLGYKVEDYDMVNENEPSKDLQVSYTIKPNIVNGDEDYLYINPMQIKHLNSNPFKNETRVYPVSFEYLETYLQIANIEVPDGYVVEELPKSEKFRLDDDGSIQLIYRIVNSGNSIRLNYQYIVNKILFLPDDYEALRNFYAKVVLKNNEQIVLKKKVAE